MALYFNNAFSKRPLDEVASEMLPFLAEEYENPLTESEGAERARQVIQTARENISNLIHASPEEIFFVSSGTEANNWALKGLAYALQAKKDHIVISGVEHFSIYQTAQFLSRHDFQVTYVPVNHDGRIDPQQIIDSIKPSTFVVSVQAASDEVGVIQDVAAVSKLKERFPEVFFHTDAIQFVCYEEFDLRRTPFDLVSISSNAMYGPSGVAALYVHKGTRLMPLFHGGMQEDGMRPGLQSVSNIIGFGKAAGINRDMKKLWALQLSEMQQVLFRLLERNGVQVTGSRSSRLVDNVHCLVDVDGEALLSLLLAEGIRASTGSTCYQYAQKESHVLKAMGIDSNAARGAVLLTPGIDVTSEELQLTCDVFEKSLQHLRKLKPSA